MMVTELRLCYYRWVIDRVTRGTHLIAWTSNDDVNPLVSISQLDGGSRFPVSVARIQLLPQRWPTRFTWRGLGRPSGTVNESIARVRCVTLRSEEHTSELQS